MQLCGKHDNQCPECHRPCCDDHMVSVECDKCGTQLRSGRVCIDCYEEAGGHRCATCDAVVCDNCYKQCSKCSADRCTSCLTECNICTQLFCDTCMQQHNDTADCDPGECPMWTCDCCGREFCHNHTPSVSMNTCPRCEDTVCGDCSKDIACVFCGSGWLCSTCLAGNAKCVDCERIVCTNCSRICDNCSKPFCPHCDNSCEECNISLCVGCGDVHSIIHEDVDE